LSILITTSIYFKLIKMNEPSNTNNSKKGNIEQYIIGKTIGEGTFGKVKIATHILTGEKVKKNFLK